MLSAHKKPIIGNSGGYYQMKRMLLVGVVLIISLFLALPAMAAKEPKIGIIDTQKVLREAKAAKSANNTLQKDLDAKRATLVAKGKEVQSLDEEVKKATGTDRGEKADKLAQLVKEYKRLDSDLGEELKKKQLELTQKLIIEIRQVVKTISDKENYSLILEKGSVVQNDDSLDITDKVIRLYDSQKK
jgi:outer membrane protein